MKLDQLQKSLISAARQARPDETVPYAFEKRVMANLQNRRPLDLLAVWSQALWRGAFTCVVITVLASLISIPGNDKDLAQDGDLSEDLEQTVMASFHQTIEENW